MASPIGEAAIAIFFHPRCHFCLRQHDGLQSAGAAEWLAPMAATLGEQIERAVTDRRLMESWGLMGMALS